MHADKELDLRHIPIPLCFLEFKNTLQAIGTGEIAEVLIGDRDTLEDLRRIIDHSGDQVVGIQKEHDFYRLRVKRGGEDG